jgi:hypothetical protein
VISCFVSPPSQGYCATSDAQAAAVDFLEQLSIQTHKKFNQHHSMSDSDENIQLPNYREILSGATSYHDAVNRVKPHLHSTLKLPAKNPLQPEAKATPRDFHRRGESDDHRNDFLDEEDSIYGNSTQQQQLPQAQGKPIDLPMSGFKSRAVYCEVSASSSLLEILSFISAHMGKASLQTHRFF